MSYIKNLFEPEFYRTLDPDDLLEEGDLFEWSEDVLAELKAGNGVVGKTTRDLDLVYGEGPQEVRFPRTYRKK